MADTAWTRFLKIHGGAGMSIKDISKLYQKNQPKSSLISRKRPKSAQKKHVRFNLKTTHIVDSYKSTEHAFLQVYPETLLLPAPIQELIIKAVNKYYPPSNQPSIKTFQAIKEKIQPLLTAIRTADQKQQQIYLAQLIATLRQ